MRFDCLNGVSAGSQYFIRIICVEYIYIKLIRFGLCTSALHQNTRERKDIGPGHSVEVHVTQRRHDLKHVKVVISRRIGRFVDFWIEHVL